MRIEVDPNQVDELSMELKRLSKIIENMEMHINKEIHNLINETNSIYSEPNVRVTTSEIAILLQEIRLLAVEVTEQLYDKSKVLTEAAGQLREEEVNTIKLLQKQMKSLNLDKVQPVGLLRKRTLDTSAYMQADKAPASPRVFPSYYDLLKNWMDKYQPVDAASGAAPSRKEIIQELFDEKLVTFSGVDDHKNYPEAVIKRYMSGTPIAQDLFLKYIQDNSLKEQTAPDDTSFYRDSIDTVFLNIAKDYTKKGTGVVFFHEYGHYLDDAAGRLSNDKVFRDRKLVRKYLQMIFPQYPICIVD
ncbi:hypothetical protein J2T12_001338 [Paenibacillus anaericanus]|uniref:hypothetical protein n=1 Tax=Paenibacillus anaericanus TaxID=170367 RepID=UPI002783E159|nr:hypothetical protein [Paenibacillus anaericanus]MDQ0087932.1 hypothetical protein [Paenibacillus anaericanus]